MRKHTKEYKKSISTFGRELDSRIEILGSDLVLDKNTLYSVTPIQNTDLLKSVMKEVDFESSLQIGVNQEINVQSGIKVNGEYEYVDYGNYVVYKSEYKAETQTYSHICYDKMLNTMIDYTPLNVEYPISVKELINAIATKCGLIFANYNEDFVNSEVLINDDHFSNGDYTFRDVLDYLSQIVGGWICIDKEDRLEVRYPTQAKEEDIVSGEEIVLNSEIDDRIKELSIDGKSYQETRSGKNEFDNSNSPLYKNGVSTSQIDTGIKVICNSTTTNIFAGFVIKDLTNYVGKTVRMKADFVSSSNNSGRYYIGLSSSTGTNRLSKADTTISGTEISFVVPELSSGQEYLVVSLYGNGGTGTAEIGDYVDYTNIIVTIDNADMSYEQFGTSPSPDYPSEIISIGSYNSEEDKYLLELNVTGKNLFSGFVKGKGLNSNTGVEFESSSGALSDYIPVDFEKDTSYTVSGLTNTLASYIAGYDEDKVFTGRTSATERTNLTFYYTTFGAGTPSSNKPTKYIRVYQYVRAGTTGTIDDVDNLQVMLNKGTTVIEYEPYKSSITQFKLDQPLRSIGDIKDNLYIEKGRLKRITNFRYLELAISDMNGSEDYPGWNNITSLVNDYPNENIQLKYISNFYCNIDKENGNGVSINTKSTGLLFLRKAYFNLTQTQWKEQYPDLVFKLCYQLKTPIVEDLGEIELPYIYKGNNYISLSSNITTNIEVTYYTNYEELNREFLKDVNVTFSKKYGKINSLVFSRGGGSDNIYRKDYDSISANGLTEIKISDNPFLEGDDRENFIQAIFDKLNGLEFYIMDVFSTGITYLEIGDLYYFNMSEDKPSLKSGLYKAGTRKAQGSSMGKYICLLLNDEVKITQGLEESIYTDEPEITETDYKTASVTDKSIKNAIIQTNKNSAEILLKVNSNEVVSAINLSPEKIKIRSSKIDVEGVLSVLGEAGSTVINGANITTGSISCDRLNGGTINGQKIVGGSINITKGNYYFNMGDSTSNPNVSGLNVGYYGIKSYSDITATGFAITDSDTGKSVSIGIYDGHGQVWYLTFKGGILTASEYSG